MAEEDLMTVQFLPVSEAVESQVGDEVVLLHLTNGVYFGMDAIGAMVWHGLKNGTPASDILTSLLLEFDVAPEVLELDMRNFLNDLIANDLVKVQHSVE
jgi:hypothetical protein